MHPEEVKAAVRDVLLDEDIDALYGEFTKEVGGTEPDRFLGFLRDRNKITDQTFRELHSRGTLVLKSLQTISEDVFDSDTPPLATEASEEPDEHYTYLGKVGEGAMGEIQIARDHILQRKVAIKRMHANISHRGSMAARFLCEAQITAQLDHPNIVPVYELDMGADARPMGYTMKLIRGRTLEDIIVQCRDAIDQKKPLAYSLDERLEHFLKVCDAMDYAHSRGVVHRDLKPENIMVGPFNEVYVMDWGIARMVHGESEQDADLVVLPTNDGHKTRAGTVIGTPAFMSPEQAEGRNDELDGRSDLFSLGLILFELVSLERAVRGETAVELMSKIQVGRFEPLRHYGHEAIATEIAAIIGKATMLEPEDRYQSVRDLAADIRRYRKGEAVLARPDTLWQMLLRWMSKHREIVLLVMVGLMGLVVVVTFVFMGVGIYQQQAAKFREARLSELISTVGRQGHVIDGHLRSYEDVVNVFATQMVTAVNGPPPEEIDGYFETAESFAPPDFGPSEGYGRDISVTTPVFSVPGQSGTTDHLPILERLYAHRHAFERAIVRSDSPESIALEPEIRHRMLRKRGTPLAWAQVAFADGVFAAYPGHSGLAPGYDGRKAPWYRIDEELHGPQWGSPYVDTAGLGLVLPCSVALHDPDSEGGPLGVASVALPFDTIIDRLLVPDQIPHEVEGFLVDGEGRIVIRSSEERMFGERQFTRALRLKKFPVPELVTAVQDRSSGYLEVDGELMVFYKMNAIGWFYVMKGSASELLGS